MKKNIFLLVFICVFINIKSQNPNTLTLKNGSSYYGKLVSKTNGKITFMGNDLNTYIFDTSEVKSILNTIPHRIPSSRLLKGSIHDISAYFVNEAYRGRLYSSGVKVNYAYERVFKQHSLGAELSVFITFDFAPTIGLKYRYELLKKVNTPFVQASIGNYYDPFWSAGMGYRVGSSIGYQWGMSKHKRKYLIFDVCRVTNKYYGTSNNKFETSNFNYSVGLGFRL